MSENKTKPVCPKCESKNWMTDLEMAAGYETSVCVERAKPGGFFGGEPDRGLSPIHPHVCGDCGYTEFYATNPQDVLAAWRKKNA